MTTLGWPIICLAIVFALLLACALFQQRQLRKMHREHELDARNIQHDVKRRFSELARRGWNRHE